jgi:hypothetical protein
MDKSILLRPLLTGRRTGKTRQGVKYPLVPPLPAHVSKTPLKGQGLVVVIGIFLPCMLMGKYLL